VSDTQNNLADPDRVLGSLGVSEPGEAWRSTWMLSGPSFKSEAMAAFRPRRIEAAWRAIGMPAEIGEAIQAGLVRIERSEALRRLAWHCHWLLFSSPPDQSALAHQWPDLSQQIGADGRMFYAIVLLSGLEVLQAHHRRRGIPESVTVDTLSDLERRIREFRNRHGVWGLEGVQWLQWHFTCHLVKLGRLQYQPGEFPHSYRVFRNRADGRVVMLAGAGMRFRADGQFDGANGVTDADHAWTAEYSEDGSVVRGNRIHPRGYAERELIELSASQWTLCLAEGDPIFFVHIPGTGKMDYEQCGESFRWAASFLPRHFADHPGRAFVCQSWLMDTQFEQYLRPDSNIVGFLGEHYLYPLPGASDRLTLETVFGSGEIDLETAPRRTSLQRAIIRHMRAGRRCRGGGGFILPQDLDWGTQPYRTRLRPEQFNR